MRIAHIIGGAALGGAEAFYERLAIAQHMAGDTVLAVIRRNPERALRLAEAGLRPVELGFGSPLDLFTGPRLRRLLGDFAPEVTVAWQNRAAWFAPRGPWALVGRLGGYYNLKYYRRCEHLVGNTQDLVRWIIAQGWPAARVHHLPNFAHDLQGAAPATLPAPPGARRLLAMGRLHANKGFDLLLRAMQRLPEAHLSLAGEGPERAALERLAQELGVAGRVAFLGWREDVGALLAACEVFVCPSRHEPLGNVVLEAWSAGRPVVAAAAQGPSELVLDGETGLLAPLENEAALAEAIGALLADARRAAAIASAGRAAFLREHAEAPVLARWRDFLQAVSPARDLRSNA